MVSLATRHRIAWMPDGVRFEIVPLSVSVDQIGAPSSVMSGAAQAEHLSIVYKGICPIFDFPPFDVSRLQWRGIHHLV